MIIPAKKEHAQIISQLLCESIKSEAIHYYENDPDTLNYWLSDKSPEMILEQIQNENESFYLLSFHEKFIGVGSMSDKGEINRCYIHSNYLKKGHGGKLLQHMINEKSNLSLFTVFSSLGAVIFYEKNGFAQTGLTEMWGPMKMVHLQKNKKLAE